MSSIASLPSRFRFRQVFAVGCGIVGSLILASSSVAPASAATEAQRVDVAPGKSQLTVNLRDRLVVGLQARLKTEVQFVETVALRVRTGHLPQRLVDQTFFWARQRAGASRRGKATRPIIYFQPAMAARAKRLGVSL